MFCRGTVSLSPQTVECIGLYRKLSSHFCSDLLGILESDKLTTCLPAECQAKLINDWTSLLLLIYMFFSKCTAFLFVSHLKADCSALEMTRMEGNISEWYFYNILIQISSLLLFTSYTVYPTIILQTHIQNLFIELLHLLFPKQESLAQGDMTMCCMLQQQYFG